MSCDKNAVVYYYLQLQISRNIILFFISHAAVEQRREMIERFNCSAVEYYITTYNRLKSSVYERKY